MAFPRDPKSIDYRWRLNMRKIRSNPERYGLVIDQGYINHLNQWFEKQLQKN